MTDDVARTEHPAPDPVTAALEAFVAAPNIFETMVGYLSNPKTPQTVRQVIADILDLGERLGTQWMVA